MSTQWPRQREILSLIIAARGVKPAVAMKTISGRFWFVVFGVIVIVAVGSCCCLPHIPANIPAIASYSVEIGNQGKGPKYVPWKQPDFDNALKQVLGNPRGNGKICICVLESSQGSPHKHPLNNDNDCLNYHCYSEKIRTVKVTKSKVADAIAAGGSAANDPSVMHRVQSSDPDDIKKVLDALQP